MSWDSQVQALTDSGYTAAIYEKESGAPYTTNALDMKPEHVKATLKAIESGAAAVSKIHVCDDDFMVLRNDEDCCYFKKAGKGAGCAVKTKTLIVIGKSEEGQQQGDCNEKLRRVTTHLNNMGY